MTLRLSSRARGARTRVSLTGTVRNDKMTLWRRRRLVALLALWAQGQVHVVFSADVRDCSGWMEEWLDALDVVEKMLSVSFGIRSDRRRGGLREN